MSRSLRLLNSNLLCYNYILKRFAGHSKWANIKHIKAAKDTQKANVFLKLSRQIKVAVQEGGSVDPKSNMKLEQVIQQAKRINMPIATIESVLRSVQTNKNQAKTYVIEIKGPGSCMILCEVFTDHLHHLRQTIASILKKNSAKYVDGGAHHAFQEKGIIDVENAEKDLEKATEDAIEIGAEDVKSIENYFQFVCAPTSFNSVQDNLLKINYVIKNAGIEYLPIQTQALSEDDLQTCSVLYDKLENLPEVVKLYDNIA